MQDIIQRINSNYNKKIVFSYLKYNYVLKLIKYNKLIQNQLDLTQRDYLINSKHYGYKYQKIPITLESNFLKKTSDDLPKYLYYLLIFLNCTIFYILKNKIILFILCFIFEIIKDGIIKEYKIKFGKEDLFFYLINFIVIIILAIVFGKIKLISDNVKNKLMLIPKINKGIIIYIPFIIFIILFYGYLIIMKFKLSRYVIISVLLIFFGLNCFYEYLILLKMQILREFDKDNLSYNDYGFLLFNNIILVLSFIYLINYYFLLFPIIITKYYFNAFKNIRINDYLLSCDFEKIKSKNKYLCREAKFFTHSETQEEKQIISQINIYRIENGLQKITLIDKNIPEFIINDELSEINLFTHQNLFHLGHEKYLFRYTIGEFVDNIKNHKDIILKPNLNRINIIIRDTNALILIYEYNENKNENDKKND